MAVIYTEGESLGALGEINTPAQQASGGYQTVPVYQLSGQAPTLPDNALLQQVYGTTAMPAFEWVRSIQSGERTYNPASDFDNQMLEQYQQATGSGNQIPGMPSVTDLIGAVAPGAAGMVGQSIGAAIADPFVQQSIGGVAEAAGTSLLPEFLGGTPLPSKQLSQATSAGYDLLSSGTLNPAARTATNAARGGGLFQPEVANIDVARATGNLDLYNKLQATDGAVIGSFEGSTVYNPEVFNQVVTDAPTSGLATNITSEAITSSSTAPTYLEGVGDKLFGSGASATWTSAGVGAVLNFGVGLLMGQDPVKAAKSAGAGAIGTAIGTAIGGPIGGFIGGALGGMLGGRVICNELMRQGLMTRKQVVLDYRFTRDYLTTYHVNGYHAWSIWVVKQMRQGRFVKTWKHIACHRANEIAYIYGERDKPDYLGKVYRRIFEPTCWLIGRFKEKSDWSVLYTPKEI